MGYRMALIEKYKTRDSPLTVKEYEALVRMKLRRDKKP